MNVKQITAVGIIFLVACAGWITLGMTTTQRSMESAGKLGPEWQGLWATPLV